LGLTPHTRTTPAVRTEIDDEAPHPDVQTPDDFPFRNPAPAWLNEDVA
jgi:hypothetical protein